MNKKKKKIQVVALVGHWFIFPALSLKLKGVKETPNKA